MVSMQYPQEHAPRRTDGVFKGAERLVVDWCWRTLVRTRRIAATGLVAAVIAGGGLASSALATANVPACPDTVIPNVAVIPNAVGCWNAIAVQATRLATPYQPQGLLYMGYIQTAVYDAVTKIDRRYVPYHEFPTPQRRLRRTRCSHRRS
jgi:hypothetical protein